MPGAVEEEFNLKNPRLSRIGVRFRRSFIQPLGLPLPPWRDFFSTCAQNGRWGGRRPSPAFPSTHASLLPEVARGLSGSALSKDPRGSASRVSSHGFHFSTFQGRLEKAKRPPRARRRLPSAPWLGNPGPWTNELGGRTGRPS